MKLEIFFKIIKENDLHLHMDWDSCDGWDVIVNETGSQPGSPYWWRANKMSDLAHAFDLLVERMQEAPERGYTWSESPAIEMLLKHKVFDKTDAQDDSLEGGAPYWPLK